MKLNDFDKTLLLLVSALTISVIVAATALQLTSLITMSTALKIDLMAIGWFFGAIMTFVFDRVKGRLNRHH